MWFHTLKRLICLDYIYSLNLILIISQDYRLIHLLVRIKLSLACKSAYWYAMQTIQKLGGGDKVFFKQYVYVKSTEVYLHPVFAKKLIMHGDQNKTYSNITEIFGKINAF